MPKPALTPDQQEFLQALVGDLANKAADVLEQRGMGSFHQLFQQYGHQFFQQQQQPPPAPPSQPQHVPPPGSGASARDPRVPYQPVYVYRNVDGRVKKVGATVPQLLAEQADQLKQVIHLLEILALDRNNGS